MGTDPALDALSDSTHRAVVAVLSRHGAVARERLVELVAASEPSESRRRVRDALASDHLPRLADAGVVEYDTASVTPAARLAVAAARLPEADRRDAASGRSVTDDRGPASDAGPELRERLTEFYA